VDEVAELAGVADEEDRRVVAHHVPIAFFGIELDGKAARIALRVARPLFAAHGGEANEHAGLLADLVEDFRGGIAGDVAGHGKDAVSARTLGVNHAFGNPLAVEVRHLFEQLVILDEHRSAGARRQGVLVVANRTACGRGESFLFFHTFHSMQSASHRNRHL
jgi:hypothetical protein